MTQNMQSSENKNLQTLACEKGDLLLLSRFFKIKIFKLSREKTLPDIVLAATTRALEHHSSVRADHVLVTGAFPNRRCRGWAHTLLTWSPSECVSPPAPSGPSTQPWPALPFPSPESIRRPSSQQTNCLGNYPLWHDCHAGTLLFGGRERGNKVGATTVLLEP